MIALTIDITLRQDAFTLDVSESASVEVLGLFGPSGSGKTSLLEAVVGLRHPTRGAIKIGDRDLYNSDRRIDVPARERRIGYVPQDALLFPHLDVTKNILFGRREPGTGNREPNDAAPGSRLPAPEHLFDSLVEILELSSLLDRRVQHLSGGEKQRVAIGRALMIRPALLLLDEPLAAVDRERRDRIVPYLLRIRKQLHVPLVYVTHDADELTAIADRVLKLEAGRVVASGPPSAMWPAATR
jgi:molybdate transport system ATP-binding protein